MNLGVPAETFRPTRASGNSVHAMVYKGKVLGAIEFDMHKKTLSWTGIWADAHLGHFRKEGVSVAVALIENLKKFAKHRKLIFRTTGFVGSGKILKKRLEGKLPRTYEEVLEVSKKHSAKARIVPKRRL